MKKLNYIRQRTDGNVYRCVTVDNLKTWNKFSYREFVDETEERVVSFTALWDAIHYFEDQIKIYMQPWITLSNEHKK